VGADRNFERRTALVERGTGKTGDPQFRARHHGPDGPEICAPGEHIATFDQDGTLWVEHPVYSQMMYCLDRVPVLAKQKPALKNVEPFKTVLSGDRDAIAKLPLRDLEKIILVTLTGITTDEFEAEGMARHGKGPALEAALHGTHLSTDVGGFELSECEWF
jgi:hypothetical protein